MKKVLKRILVLVGLTTLGVFLYNLVKKQKDVDLCAENDCVECAFEDLCD